MCSEKVIQLIKAEVTSQMMRNFVIERLLELGIRESQTGVSIYDLDYEALKYELTLAAFREIDVMSDANKYF